ncbi:MAG: hypothetical protein IT544_01885 [Rhodobacteraceae bacterium]|nr:hypothetical protein [Paracoccaceae bacterium]
MKLAKADTTMLIIGRSDWVSLPLPFPDDRLRLRLMPLRNAVGSVQVKDSSSGLGYLPDDLTRVDIMAHSPESTGLRTILPDYTCGFAIPRALHEDL